MRIRAQGRAQQQRRAARRGELDDDTADRASPTDPRRRGVGAAQRADADAGGTLRELTDEMIASLARRLWERRGGNAVLNWLEAERALQDLLQPAG